MLSFSRGYICQGSVSVLGKRLEASIYRYREELRSGAIFADINGHGVCLYRLSEDTSRFWYLSFNLSRVFIILT